MEVGGRGMARRAESRPRGRGSGGRCLQSLVTERKRGSPVIEPVMLIYHLPSSLVAGARKWLRGVLELGQQQKALMTWYHLPNSIVRTCELTMQGSRRRKACTRRRGLARGDQGPHQMSVIRHSGITHKRPLGPKYRTISCGTQ